MMKLCGLTDIGLVRKDNQDTYFMKTIPEYNCCICVVCDGMGGAAGGKIASRIAANVFAEEMERSVEKLIHTDQFQTLLTSAVSSANRAVRQAAAKSPDYSGMGTTLVSAISYGKETVIANVGDSRAYHIGESGIKRITKDHSLVESMVDRGDITPEEARRHPNRNLITRALGTEPEVLCDCFHCTMEPGDYLLLCTDGLVDAVTDQEMLFEILHGTDMESCLNRLLEISKSRGAKDNITAVLMKQE